MGEDALERKALNHNRDGKLKKKVPLIKLYCCYHTILPANYVDITSKSHLTKFLQVCTYTYIIMYACSVPYQNVYT